MRKRNSKRNFICFVVCLLFSRLLKQKKCRQAGADWPKSADHGQFADVTCWRNDQYLNHLKRTIFKLVGESDIKNMS